MKKILLTILISIIIFGSTINTVDARSGCCSHHGGVCSCNCCDGTPLSAKCAPYYPECNNSQDQVKQIPERNLRQNDNVSLKYFVGKPGNINDLMNCYVVSNTKTKIYHLKGSRYIKQMTPSYKECFATEQEAINKGYRKAKAR